MNRGANTHDFKDAMRLLDGKAPTYIAATVICNAIGSVCYNIVLAIVMQRVLDAVQYQEMKILYGGVWIAVLSFFVAFIFEPIFARIRNNCVRSTIAKVRREIFVSMTDMPVDVYETMKQGDVLTKTTQDVELLERMYLNYIPNLFFAVMHGGIAIGLMFYYSVQLGAVALLLGVIQAMVNARTSRSINAAAVNRQKSQAELMQKVVDTLDGNVDIKMSHGEEFFYGKFKDVNQILTGHTRVAEQKKAFIEDTDNFFENVSNVVVLGLGLLMVLKGTISIGTVVAIISLQGNASYLFNNMSMFMAGLADALPSVNRVMEMLHLEGESKAKCNGACPRPQAGVSDALTLHKLSFGYDAHALILNELDCNIARGKLVLWMGESGEGKSTLIKILLGFYKPWDGTYFLDGKNTTTLGAQGIRSQIAYLDQSSQLFEMSVMENVRLGNVAADDMAVMRACKLADAHDFIMELEKGYDTMLYNGDTISGGQRQRIALARMLLSDRPILLIDEGTANLDSKTEGTVMQGIAKVKREKTIIVISHKDGWKQYADEIYVLKGGRLCAVY